MCFFKHAIIIGLLFLSLANVTAEQRIPIPGTSTPFAICSFCEGVDSGVTKQCRPRTVDNYCTCRKELESPFRVLVQRKKKDPIITFGQYQTQQVQELIRRLTKRKTPPDTIKKEVSKLKKKLNALHLTYKSSCVSPPANKDPSGNYSEIIARGPFTVELLSVSGLKHSFASAISPQGRVLGGAYQQEGSQRAPALSHGLARADLVGQEIVPAVWDIDGPKLGCTSCPKGLVFVDLNDRGIAVGSRSTGATPSQQAFVFDYGQKNVARLPTASSGFSTATGINDAGIIVGQVEKIGSAPIQGVTPVDAASWVGTTEMILDRQTIISAHDKALAPELLARIKAQLKESQDSNECSDQEIEQTKLISTPRYEGATILQALRVTLQGDILGTLFVPQIFWPFQGPCQQGEGQLPLVQSTFIRKVDGSFIIVPGATPLFQGEFTGLPTDLNSKLMVIGLGIKFETPGSRLGVLQAMQLQPVWRELTLTGIPPEWALQGFAVNEQGDIVGSYDKSLAAPSTVKPTFSFVKGVFRDLTELLGPESDWIVESVSDINSCGQIVGRARNSKTGVNRAILFSPEGCPRGK
jgi:hypothetical protein